MSEIEREAEDLDGYEPHVGASRQYMRDIILGVNDGLVSTFLLVSGVVGGGLESGDVLLTGVAGALAGMVSMAIGEYLATKSQEEVFDAELALEREHIKEFREHERNQLRDMLAERGLDGDDLETVVNIMDKDEETMLNMHAALEFGIIDDERRSPVAAAVTSGLLFLSGSLPSVVPFAIWDDTGTGLLVAAILTGIALFVVGVVKTVHTKTNPIWSGTENLGFGLIGGAIAFGVGRVFESLIAS